MGKKGPPPVQIPLITENSELRSEALHGVGKEDQPPLLSLKYTTVNKMVVVEVKLGLL